MPLALCSLLRNRDGRDSSRPPPSVPASSRSSAISPSGTSGGSSTTCGTCTTSPISLGHIVRDPLGPIAHGCSFIPRLDAPAHVLTEVWVYRIVYAFRPHEKVSSSPLGMAPNSDIPGIDNGLHTPPYLL